MSQMDLFYSVQCQAPEMEALSQSTSHNSVSFLCPPTRLSLCTVPLAALCPGGPVQSPPPAISSFFVLSSVPLSLHFCLALLCVSRWPNRQICSFSTGLWISYNRPQTLSPASVLPGWEAKQREEGGDEMKAHGAVRGREVASKSFCIVHSLCHFSEGGKCVCLSEDWCAFVFLPQIT